MVQFLFIRHGESKDNLRPVWAGWKDSPLSNHGMRQSEALADDLKRIKLSAIYSSDLLRAKTTAGVVKEKQPPNVSYHQDVLLREQNFGVAEGLQLCKKEKNLSLAAHYAKGKFPVLYTRQEKFPGGESLDDVAARADLVVDEILLPNVFQEAESNESRMIAIFSHGLFIAELLAAVIRRDKEFHTDVDIRNLRGMKNTGWTRLEVTLKPNAIPQDHTIETPSSNSLIPLKVKVTGVNRHPHLSNLVNLSPIEFLLNLILLQHRQKGGIGSLAHDPTQLDIRSFLGGKQKPKSSAKPN